MKSEKNLLLAFLLNLGFSLFEFAGGLFTGSIAILSDALHDLGDAVSIGLSWGLERKSKQQPDATHTYGYLRYSVLGSVITTVILLAGSLTVAVNAAERLWNPVAIRYDGMILLAVIGLGVNLLAAFVTRHGESLNQKAVNLHMLEDVLGWAVVLVGGIVMRFTHWQWIDPVLSMGVAAYIFVHAFSHLKEAVELFLVKTPHGLEVAQLQSHLKSLEHVLDVHHIHVWSMDGNRNYATMHIVTDGDPGAVKEAVKDALRHMGVEHATLELETPHEQCDDTHCHIHADCHHHHHHHHHHS